MKKRTNVIVVTAFLTTAEGKMIEYLYNEYKIDILSQKRRIQKT